MKISASSVMLDSAHLIPVEGSAGLLCVGLPGTGKSITCTLAAMKIMKKFGAILEVADTKRSDLFSLRNILRQGDKRVVSTPAKVARMLRVASTNLNKRYEHFNYRWGWTWLDYGLRPVVIFFDEVGATLSEANRQERSEIIDYLKQIIFRSRQMGFYVILSSQRLSASTLDRDLTLELGTRIVMGGNADPDTLRMAFPGVDVNEISAVRNIPGHGLIYTDLLGTNVPQSIVVDDPSNIDIPKTIKYLDNKANSMRFVDESEYWQW